MTGSAAGPPSSPPPAHGSLALLLLAGWLAGSLAQHTNVHPAVAFNDPLLPRRARSHDMCGQVSNLERSETKRYLEMLYVLRLRPLIEKVSARTWRGKWGRALA